MIKVQCIGCGKTGYTASPDRVICQDCGSKYRVIGNGRAKKLIISILKKGGQIPFNLPAE